MGVDAKKLAAAVVESKAAGAMTPELYRLVAAVVRVAAWDRRSNWGGDLDDLIQEVAMQVHLHLDHIDPAGNPFSYVVQAARFKEQYWHKRGVYAARLYRKVAERLR